MSFGIRFKLAKNNKILTIQSWKEPGQLPSELSEQVYVKALTQELEHCKLAVNISCCLPSLSEEEMERFSELPRAVQLEGARTRIRILSFCS